MALSFGLILALRHRMLTANPKPNEFNLG